MKKFVWKPIREPKGKCLWCGHEHYPDSQCSMKVRCGYKGCSCHEVYLEPEAADEVNQAWDLLIGQVRTVLKAENKAQRGPRTGRT